MKKVLFAAAIAAIVFSCGTTTGYTIDGRVEGLDAPMVYLSEASGAVIDEVTDANGLQAIKVTLPAGILFATGKSDLNSTAVSELRDFAVSLARHPDTDITINGHTDNTGSRAVNERLSLDRAKSVENFLVGQGLPIGRFTANGLAYDVPVADNSTPTGRAQNRRVEIFLTASQKMIQQAQAGTLQ